MSLINHVLRDLLHLVFFPFLSLSPWITLVAVSFLTGLFVIFIYKFFSDQRGLKATKDKIKAYLLELRLFGDDFSVSLKAQANLLFWNLKYFLKAFRPMAIIIIPLFFLLSHLNLWFAWQPLTPGERTIVKIKLKEKINPLTVRVFFESTEGYKVETPPLRIESEREICWRIRALKPGKYQMKITLDDQSFNKELIIGRQSMVRLSPVRPSSNLWQQLLAPGEKPLSSSSVDKIEIKYPFRRFIFLGLKMHWLVVYFILTIMAGLILKKPLKIEI